MSTPTPGASDAPTAPPASPAEASRPPVSALDWIDEARQTAAQCWCDDETRRTTMDVVLAEAVAKRIASWMADAAQSQRNADYYRGLVVRCGQVFGKAAHIADDGSDMQDVLCAKVPELVEALASQCDALRAQLALCRAVLEECRPTVKARLLDSELRFPSAPTDDSILTRIEAALAGAPVPDELAATKARLDVARSALEHVVKADDEAIAELRVRGLVASDYDPVVARIAREALATPAPVVPFTAKQPCDHCRDGALLSPGWVCNICRRRGRLSSPGETAPPQNLAISHLGEPLGIVPSVVPLADAEALAKVMQEIYDSSTDHVATQLALDALTDFRAKHPATKEPPP